LGVTLTSPIEVLKTRLQVQHDKELKAEKYSHVIQSFKKIWRDEGIKGMFKGYRATVVTTPLFHALYFPFYEKLRLYFAEKLEADK